MKNNFDAEKEFGFEELEDRLEMAQVAAGDVARVVEQLDVKE